MINKNKPKKLKLEADSRELSLERVLYYSTVKLNTIDHHIKNIFCVLLGEEIVEDDGKSGQDCISLANEVNVRLNTLVKQLEKVDRTISSKDNEDQAAGVEE